ncbi:MAG: bifunctional DNA-formamidopyrimidine glycosylase/DNA-(apurinic or apyrimidinic site) lyase [Anaerolineales bacterium]|nr:bifunctional DNA-formamidopyrimidine glycosylase/DNA-(apurinic or apyrimidinic site) lyase [Anaerolineales bacterium]
MPELPEVETIAARLRKGGRNHASTPPLLGKRIISAQVFWERTLAEPTLEKFKQKISGQLIREISRRGKFLLMDVSGETLLIHLRMSGDLLVETDDKLLSTYYRMVLSFEDGIRLALNDPRKFARVWLTANPDALLSHLGPEPLAADFAPDLFYRRLVARRRQLKPLLMDQSFLAGLGNIYTDEALHQAGLHPQRISTSLDIRDAERLWMSIRHVLKEGIRRNGASIDWVYRGGDFQNYFRVYQRNGEPCPVCDTPIQRITVGQRGTHFCPQCQRLEE